MAAICRGVTPGYMARCFLRQAGKLSRGSHLLPDTRNQLLLQRSHLHTVFGCSRPSSRAPLSRRHHGKLVWVNAAAVRHSSSQIPPDEGSTAPPDVEVLSSPPVLESSSMSQPADWTPVITQAVPEQMTAETVSMTTSAAEHLTLPPSDPAPALTPPLVEQVVDAAPTAADILQAVAAEPRLAELGLGSYTPVGLVQNLLEFFHLDLGLPWWGAIVVGTVLARLVMFPVSVKGQRELVKLNNVMPELNKLTNKLNDAKRNGNPNEYSKAYYELNMFQKAHDVNPLRGFLVPLAQSPVFISFFIALRKMAYLPVPSLQTGGALWFTDLTAADPFYILPLAVTGTMLLILELGAESGIDNPSLRVMKTVFRVLPFVILPFTINFPTAVFTYWMTSNSFSLLQAFLLKNSVIRRKLRIPDKVEHPASALIKFEGPIERMKKAWKDAQLVQHVEQRDRRIKNSLDLAAKGPLRQTFTHNPRQQLSSANPKEVGVKAKPWRDTIG